MTAPAYPRDRVEDVLFEPALAAGHRVVPRHHLRTPLGTAPGDSRFCAKADGFTVLYTAPEFATAFIETVVRDRFVRRGSREIGLREVTERAWTRIRTIRRVKLRLLDLHGDGCVRLGAPTDAVSARSHAAGRALGRAIHHEHEDVDGFLFSSRLTGGDVYAVFDRAVGKLDATTPRALTDHPELPEVLSKYGIRLIAR